LYLSNAISPFEAVSKLQLIFRMNVARICVVSAYLE
jgi:hypothetical protein